VKRDVCKKGFSCGLACISRSASCRQFLRGQIGFYRTLSPVAREVYKAYTKALKALREEAPNQFNDLQAALAGGLEYRLGSLATPTGIVTAAAVRAFINRVKKGDLKEAAVAASEEVAKGVRGVAIKKLQMTAIKSALATFGVKGEAAGAMAEIANQTLREGNKRVKARVAAAKRESAAVKELSPLRNMSQGVKDFVSDMGLGAVGALKNGDVQRAMAGGLGQQLVQLGVGFAAHKALHVGATIGLGALPILGRNDPKAIMAAMAAAAAGNIARKYFIDPKLEK